MSGGSEFQKNVRMSGRESPRPSGERVRVRGESLIETNAQGLSTRNPSPRSSPQRGEEEASRANGSVARQHGAYVDNKAIGPSPAARQDFPRPPGERDRVRGEA